MPIYNSNENDVLAALEETYREMQEDIAPGRPRGGNMGRDDKEWDEAKGPEISGDNAGAPPDPRSAKQKAKDAAMEKRIVKRNRLKSDKGDNEKIRTQVSPDTYNKYMGKKYAEKGKRLGGERETIKGPKIKNTTKK